jgi:hypothetical protein
VVRYKTLKIGSTFHVVDLSRGIGIDASVWSADRHRPAWEESERRNAALTGREPRPYDLEFERRIYGALTE